MTSSRFLIHYDPELRLKLDYNASQYGISILTDGGERPIAFSSRTMTKAKKNYSHIDQEALSLVYGVKKFHSYLYGCKFVLVTDHKLLTAIFNPKGKIPPITAARMQR